MNTTFKTLGAVILILFLIAGAGCKNDAARKKIVGTWQGVSYANNLKNMPHDDSVAAAMIIEHTTYTFNPDGTFTEKMYKFESKGKWEYKPTTKKLTLTYTQKTGPSEMMKNVFEIITVGDKELKWENPLGNDAKEVYTFSRN